MSTVDKRAVSPDRQREAPLHAFIVEEERSMYREIASKYQGLGVIVDAGCFAGASTSALCEGLPRVPPYKKRFIVALDRFVVDDQYIAAHFASKGVDVRMGESFLPIFMDQMAQHLDKIDVRAGDIFSVGRVSDPIEILSIDVAKTPAINAYATYRWITRLIPEASTVCHQDFYAPSQPWLAVSMGLMANYFDLSSSWAGESANFTLKRPLDQDAVREAATTDWRSKEGLFALDRMIEIHGDGRNASLKIMRAHILRQQGDAQGARRSIIELTELEREPPFPKWRQWLSMAVVGVCPDILPSRRVLAQMYVDDAIFRLGEWRAGQSDTKDDAH